MHEQDLTTAEMELVARFERSLFDNTAINQLKRSLTTRLGPQMGFARWRKLIPRERFPDADRVEVRPLRGLGVAAEQSSVSVKIAPSGHRFEISTPKILGDGDHRALRNTSRALYVTCLPDALVRSGASAIDADGAALLDFEGSELIDYDETLDFDQAIFSYEPTYSTIWLLTPLQATHELDEAYSLFGWTALMFGHWLHEYLPKYVMASMTGNLPPASILINQWMPKSHREALALLTPDRVSIVESPWLTTTRVRRLWLSSTLNYPIMFPGFNKSLRWDDFAPDLTVSVPILEEMVRRFESAIPQGRGPERVYLARKTHLRRKLLNAPEIEAIACEAGFTVTYPEDHSFAEQFRLVRDASFVLGPEGSAMFLCMFCRPGSKVGILNHIHTQNVVITAGVLRAMGLDVTVVTGSTRTNKTFAHFSNYQIDAKLFRNFLGDWLAGKSA
jgi:capsular polysaccharide biosynthesis protein